MPTRIESPRPTMRAILGAALTLAGCGGEPSEREVENGRAFEALLTAVSLRNPMELEGDARVIDDRHAAGVLSDAVYRELREVVDRARARDWPGAEARAYKFRERFGDRGAYFK